MRPYRTASQTRSRCFPCTTPRVQPPATAPTAAFTIGDCDSIWVVADLELGGGRRLSAERSADNAARASSGARALLRLAMQRRDGVRRVLLQLVPSISDAGVEAGGSYATGATVRSACKSPRIASRASTTALPFAWQRHSETGAAARPEAVVARSVRARLDVGVSTSDEPLGAAEIRTPAFRRSARAPGMVRPVAATSVPASGVVRVLPRESTRGGRRGGASLRGEARAGGPRLDPRQVLASPRSPS